MSDRSQNGQFVVLACCAVVVVLHQATHWPWFIEDAAICFAYARNIATGEGAVPFPGGERIEAYSDPLWVALLALFHFLGVDGWTASKPLGMAFGVAALWPVWRLARIALPDHRGAGALLAPILLSLNAQFAIWSASGLENGLFGFLLAMALWRSSLEARDGGPPWSAGWFLLLAWTRPEGLLYAAAGGLWFWIAAHRAGRGLRPVLLWVAAFWGPSLALEALRIAYFAWPLPNTFYAKVSSPLAFSLDWDGRGWWQLRWWAQRLWQGWWAPIYVLALTGIRGWRARVGLTACALVFAMTLWPGPEPLRLTPMWPELDPAPLWWTTALCATALTAGLVLPFLTIGREGGFVRGICGHTLWAGLWFSIASNGDWMGGFRWMSLVAAPASVLLAVGMTDAIDALEEFVSGSREWRGAGWLAASFAAGLAIPPNFSQTRDHALYNEDVTPEVIKLRVDYMQGILDRTFYEGPVRNLDIDQGAFLWYAPHFRQHDLAKLVDIPLAHSWWQQRDFVRDYLFDEVRPTFVNIGVNNNWTLDSGLHRYPEWWELYFELPGYQMPDESIWPGVFAQHSMVMADSWQHSENRRVRFAADWVLEGFDLPVVWEAGGRGYLEAPMSTTRTRELHEDGKLIAFLTDGRNVVSWNLDLGYGIYPVQQWSPGQVFQGRHAVPLRPQVPPGTYDLGFVMVAVNGVVLPAVEAPPGAIVPADGGPPPVVAWGEVRFPGVIEVVDSESLTARQATAMRALVEASSAGRCTHAEDRWRTYRQLRPTRRADQNRRRPEAARAIADCWAEKAAKEPSKSVDHLARAHEWDHRSPALMRVGRPVARTLLDEGHAARSAGDWETAFARFRDVLRFEPWRAWARRYAEEARDHRLGLADDVMVGRFGHEYELRALEEGTP